jgi:hypothetical protein
MIERWRLPLLNPENPGAAKTAEPSYTGITIFHWAFPGIFNLHFLTAFKTKGFHYWRNLLSHY